MRSATSFFNSALAKSLLRRFWPLWGFDMLLWFLILPLPRLSAYLQTAAQRLSEEPLDIQYLFLGLAAIPGYLVAFLVGPCFAMAMFSYLTNARAANGLHALPARRETLYCTSYLTGLVCQLAVQAAALALAAPVLAAEGAFSLRVLGLAFLAMALPTVFFYSFAVLCMIFTGQILAAPVFYGIFNILAVGLELLVTTFAGNFLYGYDVTFRMMLKEFSPIIKMYRSVKVDVGFTDGWMSSVQVDGLGWLAVYALAGLLCAGLGLLLYRRRPSESAGSTIAIGWAKPIFQYGVTFCTALALGELFYALLFGQYRSNGDVSLGGTLVCVAAGGLIGFFVAEMLLRKSVRVLKSGWKGALVSTAVLLLLTFAFSLDPTGYERYVPPLEDLRGAVYYIRSDRRLGSYRGASAQTEEDLRLLLSAHEGAIQDKRRQRARERDGEGDGAIRVSFEIIYFLKDDSTVQRDYSQLILYPEDLSDAGSFTSRLSALYASESAQLGRMIGLDNNDDIAQARFTGGFFYSHYPWNAGESTGYDLSAQDAETVFQAILRDAREGSGNELFEELRPMDGILELYVSFPAERYDGNVIAGDSSRVQREYVVNLTEDMTHTIEALRAMGLRPQFS